MRYINLRLTYLETEPGLVTFNEEMKRCILTTPEPTQGTGFCFPAQFPTNNTSSTEAVNLTQNSRLLMTSGAMHSKSCMVKMTR